VTAGGKTTTDTVALRAAPLLTHHHLQRAEQLLVANVSKQRWAPVEYQKMSAKFVADLKAAAKRAGVKQPVTELTRYGDLWVQDFFEPMYLSMPGPGGRTHVTRVLFRSHQPWRDAGLELYERLRGPGVGVVQLTPNARAGGTLDSMGNLETIPPYSHNRKSYPAGRVIMGMRKPEAPSSVVRSLIAAQGLQSPLLLDTSWLAVGHVDEFVQFLPAKTPRGWRVAVADPDAGLKLLRTAKSGGHGSKPLFSRPKADGPTIDRALADGRLLADNALAARKIKENLALLKRETGLSDSEIVRVPTLFRSYGERGSSRKALGRLDQRQIVSDRFDAGTPGTQNVSEIRRMSAYIPGAVNGIVVSPTRYIAAQQWGPVIGGKDLFGVAVAAVYRKAGFQVDYLDDWLYHLGSGEVHCGTNTLRVATAPWWR
jgi:protein-arginine deiminase